MVDMPYTLEESKEGLTIYHHCCSPSSTPDEIDEAAVQEVEAQLKLLLVGLVPPHVSYNDPDQTPICGRSQILFEYSKWSTGMDLPGYHYRNRVPYLSDWFMAMYLGNYDDFISIVNKCESHELAKLLRKRESCLQLNAIFVPIVGAQLFWEDEGLAEMKDFYPKIERKHMQILNKLLELGADVNVHDVAGFTPLHQCFTLKSKNITYAMAFKLLESGADPNLRNRFGSTPLHDSVTKERLMDIQLLIDYKANPYLMNNYNSSPWKVSKCKTQLRGILYQADKHLLKNLREEKRVGSDYKQCGNCSKYAQNRCSGCYLTWYCGIDCQENDWRHHKARCKKTRAEYMEVKMEGLPDEFFAYTEDSGDICFLGVKPKSGSFTLKVQLEINAVNIPLIAYSKNREVACGIPIETKLGRKLKEVISEKGILDNIGYFYSFVQNKRCYVNPTIQPPERWR